MADAAKVELDQEEAAPKKGGRMGLIIGLAAMLALGGGGFFATFSGMLSLPFGGGEEDEKSSHAEEGDHGGKGDKGGAAPVFVTVAPMTVSLGPSARARHLRLSATLEVTPGAETTAEQMMPRIQDVMNTYLHALDEADVERPAAMARMRAHLLRRIRIVTGEEVVRDLLITEFVLQ